MIDGRPKGRFDGTAPEPNPSLPSGHILDTISLPFMQLLDPQSKTMKDKVALQQGEGLHVHAIMLRNTLSRLNANSRSTINPLHATSHFNDYVFEIHGKIIMMISYTATRITRPCNQRQP